MYKWYREFEQGDTSVIDEPRPGRRSSISTKKIETVKELLDSDRQMAIRDITIWTGFTFGAVFRIIHNQLGMRRIRARWIPHLIDENQMRQRVELSKQFIVGAENYGMDFLNRIVTVDKTTGTIKRLGFELLHHPLSHQTWSLVIFFYFH